VDVLKREVADEDDKDPNDGVDDIDTDSTRTGVGVADRVVAVEDGREGVEACVETSGVRCTLSMMLFLTSGAEAECSIRNCGCGCCMSILFSVRNSAMAEECGVTSPMSLIRNALRGVALLASI